ncbi:hypothetical protein ACGFSB_07525 [Streptomyces sp. NPDC048441]|uniref:hypothetical protein n=1 Tax=Streptomyces sp. NPDC048441 TaxID=3365552 RepID=UPI00371A1C4D
MTSWHPGERTPDDATGLPSPTLPASPAMRGYLQLHEAIKKLGFRHAADALRAPAPAPSAQGSTEALFGTLPKAETDDGFRILDGLWFPARGGLWQRVGLAYVQQSRTRWLASPDPRAPEAAAVVDTLETVIRDDPMGLRRVVLWELCCRLRDDAAPQGAATADAAAALGVHRSEAGLLASAFAAARFPAAGAARHAAETLNDIWPGTRLREAEKLAALIPAAPAAPASSADHVLGGLLSSLRMRSAAVAQLSDSARDFETRGDLRAAADAWLGALRQARDDEVAHAGLLRVAALIADAPFTPDESEVSAVIDDRAVRLAWRAPHSDSGAVSYRVLRFPDGAPELAVEVSPYDTALTAADPDAPVGRPLRYAVFPVRRDRIAGVPRVTAPVLITPDVTELRADAVPDGVRVEWRLDPAATEVRAVRTRDGDNDPAENVRCELGRLVDSPLPVGLYVYEVSCGYPGPAGHLVWSPGLSITARAEHWPSPVEALSVRRLDGGGQVRVAWRPPVRGHGHLVPWSAHPVAAGTDVSGQVGQLALVEGDLTTSVDVLPAPRERLRMTAVSVLGERAVSGPSIVIEHPGDVRDLAVRRVAADRAELRFSWPEPAVLTLIAWEDGVRREQLRVARSRYGAGQVVALPVSAGESRFTVTALPRPDAVAVGSASARAVLPAAPPPPPAVPPASAVWWRVWWRRWRHRPRRPRP